MKHYTAACRGRNASVLKTSSILQRDLDSASQALYKTRFNPYPHRDMAADSLPQFILDHYEVHEWRHAIAVLREDFPNEWNDMVDVLTDFRLRRSHIVVGGGGKSPVSKALEHPFNAKGWKEKSWETRIVVDQTSLESPTHKVDCYQNQVALEIEWSNKDPFFDRDLNNFRLLFELRAISVGVIITKADELRGIFENLGIWRKYGTSTTWMSKLLPRIEGGGGGGCPILVFGITKQLYVSGE